MKEGWGDQTGTELSPITQRVATRERFSTSHTVVARNSLKLPMTKLINKEYESMITKPLMVGVATIYMDPESKKTSFGGMTTDTFQGVATLITPKGPFKIDRARWHLLCQVLSFSDMKIDLNRERLIQETMDKDPKCRSFAWKVLRQAKLAVGATSYIGDAALATPPGLL